MQKGFSRFLGVILVFFGLVQFLPMVGISVVIGDIDFGKWFPVAFILIGLIEFSSGENSGWFWGTFAIIFGLITLRSLFNLPILDSLPLEAFFAPVLILAYGIKTLTEK